MIITDVADVKPDIAGADMKSTIKPESKEREHYML